MQPGEQEAKADAQPSQATAQTNTFVIVTDACHNQPEQPSSGYLATRAHPIGPSDYNVSGAHVIGLGRATPYQHRGCATQVH